MRFGVSVPPTGYGYEYSLLTLLQILLACGTRRQEPVSSPGDRFMSRGLILKGLDGLGELIG